jgi:hypothetical protein
MKYVGASSSNGGKTNRITIDVSAEEAEALVKLFESGQLAKLGISHLASEDAKWASKTRDGTPSDKPRMPSK